MRHGGKKHRKERVYVRHEKKDHARMFFDKLSLSFEVEFCKRYLRSLAHAIGTSLLKNVRVRTKSFNTTQNRITRISSLAQKSLQYQAFMIFQIGLILSG